VQPSLDDFERLATKLRGYIRAAGRSEDDVAFAPCLTFWPGEDNTRPYWMKVTEEFKERGGNYMVIQFSITKVETETAIQFIRWFAENIIRSYRSTP